MPLGCSKRQGWTRSGRVVSCRPLLGKIACDVDVKGGVVLLERANVDISGRSDVLADEWLE